MSSNNTGKNIANAFEVIIKTYESVQKLMSYLQNEAAEKGEYACCTDRFLRWNSDKSIYGWAYRSFILVFQNLNDEELKNGWCDGPLYVLEINLADEEEAKVHIVRFDYNDMSCWSDSPISVSEHGKFYDPLWNYEDMIDYKCEGDNYEGTVTDEATADRRYWGLRRVAGFSVPLQNITADNAYDTVFGGFNKLRSCSEIS